jgi:hypothetical protein
VAGFRRAVWIGAVLATLAIGVGGARLQAQTQLADPKDAPRIFASTCSACHKSPQGLAKSGQVAGFLRQHYTTGPEMSAAMAAYLVAAGSAPAAKKGETAQKQKSKKDASPQAGQAALNAGAADQRTLRGKQRAKSQDEQPARPAVQPAQPAQPVQPAPAEPAQQTATAPAAASPMASEAPSAPAPEAGPPLVVFDIPLPEMPQAAPADLTQSAFTSSPLP